jgi:hypothetical protein
MSALSRLDSSWKIHRRAQVLTEFLPCKSS